MLPARFPNLLVNGSVGIAVGMATNIPPHNLTETIDATFAIMDNPEISVVELMDNYIKVLIFQQAVSFWEEPEFDRHLKQAAALSWYAVSIIWRIWAMVRQELL